LASSNRRAIPLSAGLHKVSVPCTDAQRTQPLTFLLRLRLAANMIATVALALLESVQAFSAPAMRVAPVRSSAVTMFSEGDLGVLPPLGVYDPLGLIETRDMRRYEVSAMPRPGPMPDADVLRSLNLPPAAVAAFARTPA
jgi:hypothetical protein